MKTRILVVNDTQAILELFRNLLEEEGYEVILSSFPYQQPKEIEQIRPDLIILDFIFGNHTSGWQMLQMLKMQRSTNSIPVIVCSAALREVQEVEGYLVSQGVLVIYKPFKIDELLSLVSEALASAKQAAALVDEEKNTKKKE